MPSTSITIKHNNHRVHPCPNDKKLQLLELLIQNHSQSSILVVTSTHAEFLKNALNIPNVVIMNDDELFKSPEIQSDILISYDLPSTAIEYMVRLARAGIKALILLDIQEQTQLYPIETLLGRAIKQEVLSGFEYAVQEIVKKEFKPHTEKKYDNGAKEERKPKDFVKKEYKKKDFTKSEKSDKPEKWANKGKKQNKFLGKDENGKAKFSGKSGERNHKYDGSPREATEVSSKKPARTINIKALKEKKEEK